ncbi:MAG: hypothetical protein V1773_10285 [bacterium]
MSKVKRTTKVTKTITKAPFSEYWTKTNVILTISSIVVITLGFILMSKGPWDNPISLTLSPIVLIIAYVVLIPASILFLGKKKSSSEPEKTAE